MSIRLPSREEAFRPVNAQAQQPPLRTRQLEIVEVTDEKLLPLLHAVNLLVVPAAFAQGRGQGWKTDESYHSLLEWRDTTAPYHLDKVFTFLSSRKATDFDKAEWNQSIYQVTIAVAKFISVETVRDEWVTPKSYELAQAILSFLSTDNLASPILSQYLRPLFTTYNVNVSNGRRFPEPLIAVGRHHAYWEDQDDTPYKTSAGLGSWNVLSFVLSLPLDWEEVWYLLVPPLVSLLQDTDPRFRLIGVRVLSHLDAPAELVRKTGIWALFESALHANLSFTTDEEYGPSLLSASISALRKMILEQTEGLKRFDALFKLVEEGVINVWAFTPAPASKHAQNLTVASCDAFETLCFDLAKGTARFVKIAVEWLALGWLGTCQEANEATRSVMRALRACLENSGAISIKRWRETVLASLAKWRISTEGKDDKEAIALLKMMARLDEQTQVDLNRLIGLDSTLTLLASAV